MSDKSTKPSILHVIHGLRTGGAEIDLLRKLTYLKSNYSMEIGVCCLMRRGDLAPQFEALGIEVMGPLMSSRYDFTAGLKLRSLLTSSRWNIVHTHLAAANLVTWLTNLTVASQNRLPQIASEHAMAERWPPWVLWLDRRMARAVASITVPSESAAQSYLTNSIPAHKLQVIGNCVDAAAFDGIDQASAKRALCAELGINPATFLLGTICRLETIKVLPLLFESVAELGMHLVVAGDGSQRAALDALIAEKQWGERIHLLGNRGDIPSLLSAMDLFVLTSQSESFGIVIIEALLSQTPVVSTNVGAIPEITADGAYAQLIEPNDKRGLTNAIKWAVSHPKESRTQAISGRDFILANYGVERCGDSLYQLYLRTLSQPLDS